MREAIRRAATRAAAACVAAGLAACGGGGSGGTGTAAGNDAPVAAAAPLKVTFLPQAIAANATPAAGSTSASTSVTVAGATASMYVGIGSTLNGVAIATVSGDYLGALQINVTFKDAGALPDGTYADTLTFEVCEDSQCTRQAAGSPFSVPVALTVSGSRATSAPAALVAPTGFLSHDVVDAAMSRSLNAIVMASTQPANALLVFDLATGSERSIALDHAPIALALSPDGRRAAVSQGQVVSLVDLSAAQPAPSELVLPYWVASMTLDDLGVAQAAVGGGSTSLYTIDLESGIGLASSDDVYTSMQLRTPASDDRVYTLDASYLPPHLDRWSIGAGFLSHAARSADADTWPTCAGFWLGDAGDRLYTACGNVFSADPDPSRDMLYQGQLALTAPADGYGNIVVWLDDSAAAGQVALLDAGQCGVNQGGDYCATLLRLFDDRDLHATAAYFTPPVHRDGQFRVPHGRFVFHAADGSLRVVGHLYGVDDATHAYYLDTPTPAAKGGTASVGAGSANAAATRRRVAAH